MPTRSSTKAPAPRGTKAPTKAPAARVAKAPTKAPAARVAKAPAVKAAKAPVAQAVKASAKASAPEGVKAKGAVLGRRALNRALLERQLLLCRHEMAATDAVEWLVGLQAQAPGPPYFALFSRLEGFRHEALSELIVGRKAVRITLMRGTIHLVSARDALALRPALAASLRRSFSGGPSGKSIAGVDFDELAKAGRALFGEEPRSVAELGELLQGRFPGRAPDALGQALCFLVPLVQPPPRGLWGKGGRAAWTPLDAWLGRPLGADASADAMIFRYLAAFGPASINDVQTWSGLTKLREAFEPLRPRLRVFRDEGGAELFDLPDAPLPDPDSPAPPRFLPLYDNVLLSHADRSRIIDEARRKSLVTKNGVGPNTFLVDGFVAGTWAIEREKGATALHIYPFEALRKADKAALEEEGERLLAFDSPDAGRRTVRFAPTR